MKTPAGIVAQTISETMVLTAVQILKKFCQAGLFARFIAQNATFLCNMVGSANLQPGCTAKGVLNAPGAGYPINFFQVNPLATGASANYLDSAGSSNYLYCEQWNRKRRFAKS